MKKILVLIIYIALNSSFLFAQTKLTIEGITVNNTEKGTWTGVNIKRDVPTTLLYRNNSITSVNTASYQLQAGDEDVLNTNNNLKGEIISGNKLTWNGTDLSSITHGIFTGYNINATIEYNYLDKVPMAIVRKSNGMINTSGAVAYNIIKNPIATALAIKGMKGVNVYNNTIYSNQKMYNGSTGVWRGLIDIYANDNPVAYSSGTKIKNNIFYTVNQIYNITVSESEDLAGFESDYNVFYCESGTPVFNYLGSKKTFAEWQALGYDIHSKVINPNFNNTVDFVPAARLDYGTDLGTTWQAGLSTSATWTVGVSPATVSQNGAWQVGARIFNTSVSVSPTYISSVIENAAPSSLQMTFSMDQGDTVAIEGSKVRLTLATPVAANDIVTVAYSKPSANPLQSASGGQVATVSAHTIKNNVTATITDPVSNNIKMTIFPNPVHQFMSILLENVTQETGISRGIIRIFDFTGKIFIEKIIEAGAAELQFPIKLKPGFYAVVILSGNLVLSTQNIIVN
ncbi:MAG: hypothetical protein IPJ37_22330 [Bacteroidales bacterium]|nr:hypothetical protein [Bacteroidales bacterium]